MRVLLASFAYNEGEKIRRVLAKCRAAQDALRSTLPFDVLVMDDGSSDGALDGAAGEFGGVVLRNERNMGIGWSIRRVIGHARAQGYDCLAIMAGNDKDDPAQLERLVAPIRDEGYDFVQGSRYLPGGEIGAMPLHRQIATRWAHPWLFSLVTNRRFTDTTNGFRALRLSMFDDPRIKLDQRWLDRYELEPYIFYQAVRLGRRVKEVPVSKVYPAKELGYTKMPPITGWWSILRPLIYLALGVKK
jgi:dolichol-phosphate mannosyltransferase